MAEIASRLPGPTLVWIIQVAMAALALGAVRTNKWCFLPILMLAIGWSDEVIQEARDPLWLDAMIRDLGLAYVLQWMISSTLPMLAVLAGVLVPQRKPRRSCYCYSPAEKSR